MEGNQEKEEQSDNSSQDTEQEKQSESQDRNQTEEAKEVLGLLKSILKGITDVKENTSSEHNKGTLERVESKLDKLAGVLESILPGKKEEKDTTPQTPNVTVPGFHVVHIRKRGGRIVKRSIPVKEGDNK